MQFNSELITIYAWCNIPYNTVEYMIYFYLSLQVIYCNYADSVNLLYFNALFITNQYMV